jgi:DNA-binding IclR family transcriptional regulator
MLRMLTQVGRRRAAHATSSGKVLLAFGAPADVDRVVAAGMPRLGPRTITSRSLLEQALADVRADGYAVSVEESARGVSSVAAPIFDGAGECVAAMSVAGPITRMPADQLGHFARMVVAATAAISGSDPRARPARTRADRSTSGRSAPDRSAPDRSTPVPARPRERAIR